MIFEKIKKSPLFAGIGDSELKSLLDCLSAVRRQYAKEQFILQAGDNAVFVGIVLSGGALVVQEDFWGNRAILAHIGPGDLFGEAFSCAGTESLPVSVIAAEKSEILLIDCRKIVTVCSASCVFHARLVGNLLRTLAEKNILLTRKLEHLSKRTTREKLLSYLSAQAARVKGVAIDVPFNRQELAEYLCVDRSALSRELALMQREGLIRCEKNRFELLRSRE